MSTRRPATPSSTSGIALLLALLATAFRVLSSADLSNDHYMHMGWAQQLLFGELPGRDFVDPGMPLTYALSALVQYLRPGPFSELLFCAAMIGLAAAITYVVAVRTTGSPLVGIVATLFEIALQPRLYSYPKILVPAVAMLAVQAYARWPSRPRLAWLGAWTAIAVLFRHDLGVYVVAGVAAAIVVLHWGSWRLVATKGASYAALTALALLPYFVFVQWAEGISEHLRRGVEFSKGEAHQRFFELPGFDIVHGAQPLHWTLTDSVAFLFYAVHACVVIAVIVLLVRRHQLTRQALAEGAAATAMLAAYLAVILRHPIDQRLPDLAAILAIAGAAIAGSIGDAVARNWPTRWASMSLLAGVTAAVVAVSGMSIWVLGNMPERIDNTGIYGGWGDVKETFTDLRERGSQWPWARSWPSRELPQAVPYLNACTSESDAVLTTWAAPEYYFFARRRFGAGHVEFLPPDAFVTARDQQEMLSWLSRQRIPVVLINQTRREEFATAYPQVDAYIKAHYAAAGRFTIYDMSEITIAVRTDMRATRTWGADRWPCGFQAS